MARHLLLFSLFLCISLSAQSPLSFGAHLGVQGSALSLGDNFSQTVSSTEENGHFALGYGAGLDIRYELSERLFLRSGLAYQHRRNRYVLSGLRFGTDFDNPAGTDLRNDIIINSAGVPLEFGMVLPSAKDRRHFTVGGGLYFNYELSSRGEAYIMWQDVEPQRLEDPVTEITVAGYSFGLFGGIEVLTGKRTWISVEPNIRYTPNRFSGFIFSDTEGRTGYEAGVMVRVRLGRE